MGAGVEPEPRKNLAPRDMGGTSDTGLKVAGGIGGRCTGTASVESLAHHSFRNGSQLMSWEKSACGPGKRLG